MLTATTRIAYAQVNSFLNLLDDEYIQMIPRNIRYFFKQEMDTTYNKPIVADIPIKKQNLTDEALALIAYLNLNYWCKDDAEKERLRKIYQENEDKYNNELRNNQHGADEIFKTKDEEKSEIEEILEDDEENELVTYSKDNIFRRIWLKIKSKFLK